MVQIRRDKINLSELYTLVFHGLFFVPYSAAHLRSTIFKKYSKMVMQQAKVYILRKF